MTEPDILAALEADAASFERSKSSGCTLCKFLTATFDGDELAGWDAFLASTTRGDETLWRMLQSRGFASKSSNPVKTHRQQKHRPPAVPQVDPRRAA